MHKTISLFEAALPLLTMLACLVLGGVFFPIGTELLVFVMFIAAAVAGLIAARHGHDWDAIQRSTGTKFATVLPVILILLSIGMLIGTWMFSGTIPMLVYYGVQLVNPRFMIITAFLVTGMMSMTGSSWAAAGTIGVALMGVATAIEAPLAATAGAVVSGAYFGDKLSPLSDQTNICAIGANANLYDHIRNMVYTAGPSFIVALLVYLAAGILTDANSVAGSDFNHPILQEIEQAYSISWLVFIPALIVIIGTFNRKPAALVMVISSVTAMAIGIGVHGFSPYNAILSAITGFNVSMLEDMSNSSSDMLNILLNRGGINSMSTTLIIIIAAFLLAAGMDVSGGLDKLLQTMIERARSVFGLVAATLASGVTMIALTSHGGVTALIVGGLFQDGYRERGLAPENLSRSLEDSVTILEPLLPWTVSAIFMATTLGVPTLAYMPWAVFCMTGWMFSLLMASIYERTGFGLKALQAE
ncbi:MAG TPA: Na+/H+ antiporter NhaC [Gammaproteobacteria bacterium]|nr:Na+/H+ antiporter NhaC [Gammaproteobacteria bacterium]